MAAVWREGVSNSQTAPLPVFSGVQELNWPHIHKYRTVSEGKFGKTLGETFWKEESTWW